MNHRICCAVSRPANTDGLVCSFYSWQHVQPPLCALRPVQIQTENQCDIIGLNDRGPLWCYPGNTVSPCYPLLFISSACSDLVCDECCSCVSVICVESFSPVFSAAVTVGSHRKSHLHFLHLYLSGLRKSQLSQLTRQVSLCRLDVDDCKCSWVRSIYSLWVISHRAPGAKRPCWESGWADRKEENLSIFLIMVLDKSWPR